MQVTAARLPEVLLIRPQVYHDRRGHFLEIYQRDRYAAAGIVDGFVQDNVSFSNKGVLRGLHYQLGNPQDKLVVVLQGRIFDVAVDIRRNSPTFGQWISAELCSEDYTQIYIPRGFAHGFCVLSESATVLYKCTDFYAPSQERGILWNCPALGIRWPILEPIVSDKDLTLPSLESIPPGELPVASGAES